MRYVLIAIALASPASAQQFFGAAELSYGASQMAGAPVALQGADGSLGVGRGDLSFGALWDSGAYVQLDLGGAVSDNSGLAPNTYNSSTSFVLHAGRSAERFDYGLFAGMVQSDHDNDATAQAARVLVGLEGGMDFGARWSLDGHLGYLTGTSGSDSAATVTDGLFAGVGVSFVATDRLRLGTSIGYINGQMASPSTVVEAWRLQVRADYDIAAVPGMSLFAAAQYGEYHQKENVRADDITDITSVMAGVTYRFGAKRPKTARLTYLEPFLANTGGVLE